jgi:hypothetical protein
MQFLRCVAVRLACMNSQKSNIKRLCFFGTYSYLGQQRKTQAAFHNTFISSATAIVKNDWSYCFLRPEPELDERLPDFCGEYVFKRLHCFPSHFLFFLRISVEVLPTSCDPNPQPFSQSSLKTLKSTSAHTCGSNYLEACVGPHRKLLRRLKTIYCK